MTYCNYLDIIELLPLSLGNELKSKEPKISRDTLDSFCKTASVEIDNRLGQNGFTLPIKPLNPKDGDSTGLLFQNLRRIAALGATGMVTRALGQIDDYTERNSYEVSFSMELSAIVKKGFPVSVERFLKTADAAAPLADTIKSDSDFNPDGSLNYSTL